MAKGRLIVNAITGDKRINDLSDDTSRLAFTWLITFADCEGRTYGDPAMVRSMLFPRRDDITLAQMTAYIAEWAASGLVVWYEARGDKWIFFPAFAKTQTGLNKEREAESRIPGPPVEQEPLASESGASQEQGASESLLREEKRREVKLREEKIIAPPSADATSPPPPRSEKQQAQDAMIEALAEVCGRDWHLASQIKLLSKYAKELVGAQHKPEDVRAHFGRSGWWYSEDWRGKQGQLPAPNNVSEMVAQAKAGVHTHGGNEHGKNRQARIPDAEKDYVHGWDA